MASNSHDGNRGSLREASNVTLRVQFHDGDQERALAKAVYKPIQGERPLDDFPEGTLAGREVTAYLVSEWGGWGLVPPTILRDGPLGLGSVQVWVEVDDSLAGPASGLLDVFPPEGLDEGWLPLVQAQGPRVSPWLWRTPTMSSWRPWPFLMRCSTTRTAKLLTLR
ncbi:hypothetical protein [Ornithinimicrobium sp. INDO-MA30-4]|uniref:hypothetical protein n=1 Tax=Ornithinimicrobium sp. INDO-MA30-4 TaxID=2908651 RepID=UPI001F2F3A6E|nr:hypothetical protein [Ornithinimicrobium sp. INDO-MA30-4]UJH71065.1 hypothetical protein L0A91_04015 [Ornithinimicrobium sp. INDO-MA30-4]